MQYILCGGQLYRRSYDGIHLCCLKKNVAERVMEEVHQGICGPHMNGRMLTKKILTMGYYWNSTEIDCVDFMKSCHDCQTHVNLNHVPPSKPYNMISPWPFLIWGIGVIGRIALKQAEAASYFVLKAKHVAQFIEYNIICQYGVPQEIILDNGSHFEGEV